jgi:hypothetical protein
MGPGSAAHHAAKSGALRSIRGTHSSSLLERKTVIPVACEAMCPVSRTRCSVLHDAPQSRDPWRCGVHNGPRISSAPRREVRRAAQHPGNAFLIFLECKSVIPVACEAMCSVSRTRCSVLHAAPQSRDPWRRGVHNGPRISSAPRREVRRAAQHPGNAFLIFLECKSVIPVACEAMCSVSRTRRSVLHAAPQSRDPWRRGVHNGPRISSAPRREVRRAAQHPGNASLVLAPRRSFAISRRDAPESLMNLSPPWRAWGMPGARCTRGLVCTL